MAKMYYSEQEAAEKLGVSVEQLAGYVRQRKLRLFRDGTRNMYMTKEVDALAPQDAEIELTPAAEGGGKDDTSVAASGVSVFDTQD